MKRDLKTLPKWAQDLIAELINDRNIAQSDARRLRDANDVLRNREWFTIQGQTPIEIQPRKLWILRDDHPIPVCSLGIGDVLLIGRMKK
jgi:hypothetical protein